MQHEGYNFDVNGAKNDHHTYNGKEHSKDLGLNLYEMEWRHYNPTIGRFPSIDPLADHPFQLDLTPYNFAWNNPIMYNDPSGLCPECPNASDFNVGDTHDINGVTYVVDNDGQWAREGGSLGEVIINSGDNTESTRNRIDLNAPYGGKISRSIGELSGWDKFSAEAQENMPWLFGRRKSDDGRFFVDPSGNSIGITPMGAPINLPFGPGSGKKASSLVVKFTNEQKMAWWTTSSKPGISAAKAAEKMGGALVKKFKNSVDTGARSGEHGRAFIKAGQELIRQANNKNAGHLPDMVKALKTAGQRLIEKGKSINHKM